MSFIEIAGLLLALAAVLAYLNLKVLRLPTTIGLMLLALIGSVALLIVGRYQPSWVEPARRLVESVNFDDTLMHGMLGFLLFAGSLHVDLSDLRRQTWMIITLATIGVVSTTVLVGFGAYGLASLLGLDLPLIYCFIFGSLIAPTDPIAVLAIMKKVGAPKSIETKLAGESLFNDGVGVVVFLALLGVAGLDAGYGQNAATSHTQHKAATSMHESGISHELYEQMMTFPIDGWQVVTPVRGEIESMQLSNATGPGVSDPGLNAAHDAASLDIDWKEVGVLFGKEAGGGLLFGLGLGLLAYVLLRWCDDYKTEVLITLAIVTGGYALAYRLHVSGPLAMVVAGLLVGNPGRSKAMSELTQRNLDTFWELIDEILNTVLFVLIGLEVLVLSLNGKYLLAGAIAVPMVLLARFIAVGGTMSVLRNFREFTPHAAKVMTWAGLRGGISVALALALKDRAAGGSDQVVAAAELILTMTYVVVAFSIIGQGLTIAPLLRACGLAGRHDPYAGTLH